MKLGVHLVKFDFDGGPEAIGPTVAAFGAAAEEAGVDNVSVMDHYFQMPLLGGARPADARGLHHARLPGRAHLDGRPAAAGHRRHLPAPRAARQDRDHPRRAVRRPGGARARCRVVPAGARGARRPVPAGGRAVRAARGDPADRARDVRRRAGAVRREALPAGRHRQPPAPVRRPPIMVGGGASGRRCGWSRSTPTPATSSPTPTAGPPRCSRSSTCCAATATARGATTTRSPRRSCGRRRLDPSDGAGFARHLEGFAELGVTEVHVMHLGDQPVEFVQELGRSVVPDRARL